MSRIQPQLPEDFNGLAIIGEAPGRDELEQGFPFVGRAGALLDAVLSEIGIDRPRCLITNVFLSRPENNKIDTFFRYREVDGDVAMADEMFVRQYGLYRNKVVCDANRVDMERLDREFAEHAPKVILLLGATALWRVTQLSGITEARSKWTFVQPAGINHLVGVMPTYHPSFILRRRDKLSEFISDIKVVKDVLDGLIS